MTTTTRPEDALILELLAQAPDGDRIEFGVLHGNTLKLLTTFVSRLVPRPPPWRTIGVDSFEGMGEPSVYDINEKGIHEYPKGRLAAPIEEVAANAPGAELIKGFVPDILPQVPTGPYAFAYVDMDHYWPTRRALDWLWPRMITGGIVVADDHFRGRTCLAARAINERWMLYPFAGERDNRAWWVR
jgi:hypothetical protein